jgi:hypothetical protein
VPFRELLDALTGTLQGATAWPVWNAIHSDPPAIVVELTGILTCGLALMFGWVITRLGLRPEVIRQEEPGASAWSQPGQTLG